MTSWHSLFSSQTAAGSRRPVSAGGRDGLRPAMPALIHHGAPARAALFWATLPSSSRPGLCQTVAADHNQVEPSIAPHGAMTSTAGVPRRDGALRLGRVDRAGRQELGQLAPGVRHPGALQLDEIHPAPSTAHGRFSGSGTT